MKLHIAYRVYPGLSKVQAVKGVGKFALVLAGLQSMKRALGRLDYIVSAILDGCDDRYETAIRSIFPAGRIRIFRMECHGNRATFAKQLQLLSEPTGPAPSGFRMFAEDDYFYLDGAIEAACDVARSVGESAFVSPYDHIDNYRSGQLGPMAISHGGRMWRQGSHTTLTFITSARTLHETLPVLKTYCYGNFDYSLWSVLTRRGLWGPPRHLGLLRERGHGLKVVAKRFLYTPGRFLLGKRYELLSPVPSLATHMESGTLPPGFDWVGSIRNEVRALDFPDTYGR